VEPSKTDLVGIYIDFSAGPGIENARICFVERTQAGTLLCRGEEPSALRVVLNHLNAQELEAMMDMFDSKPWKIA
jgi:hypothetical protein